MDPTLLGLLARNNVQNLRGAYGLGSDASLNQTGDMMTLGNGAFMWGGTNPEGDGAQPYIPNLGGQYGDVKQVQTPGEDWASVFMGASPYKVWGEKPAEWTGDGPNPWQTYTPGHNEFFSNNPTYEIGGGQQNADWLTGIMGTGPWAQQKQKRPVQQGAFGVEEDTGGFA
jgi:hypothetical protein